jgi:hypothetical protein
MSTEEKHTWIYAIVSPITYLVYLGIVISRAQGTPVAEVAYVRPLIWTLVATIAAVIVSRIILAIIWQKDEERSPDERDREVTRFGDRAGLTVGGLGSLAGLILAMVEADHFWIANALYLGCFLGGFVGAVVKIVVYRTGFQR